MTNQPTKFEVPNSTCHGNMKGVVKCKNGVGWVVKDHPSLPKLTPFDRAPMISY